MHIRLEHDSVVYVKKITTAAERRARSVRQESSVAYQFVVVVKPPFSHTKETLVDIPKNITKDWYRNVYLKSSHWIAFRLEVLLAKINVFIV